MNLHELIKVRFDDICSMVTDGTHDSPKLQSSGVPFIKGKHISSGVVDFNNCDFITEADHKLCIKRVLPQRNDVLLSNIGSVGDCARVQSDIEFSIKNVALLRPDESQVDANYFFYLFKNPKFKAELLNLRAGSAQQFISLAALRAFEFMLVGGLKEQARIGQVLSAYDDLIENNRRRIALLEEAARLLYREWFVHFRFPGHEHVKIVDGVPEGWEATVLADLVKLVKDPVKPEQFEPDDVHIGLEHMPRRSFTLDNWEEVGGLASHKFRFQQGDILFGKIRPYFHKVGFALVDGLVSSDAFVWRTNNAKHWPLALCSTSSDYFVAVASKTVREGAKMPRADWKVLANFTVPTPPDHVLSDFNAQILPLAEMCRYLALQNKQLEMARDLLLPRLMDGRLQV